MNIEIWPAHGPLNSKDIFAKFIKSLRASGEQVWENKQAPNGDVAVIWSVLWQGRMRKYKDVWERYTKANKPVIVIEVGGIKRNETWKIGINGVNREADFANENVSGERWKKFNIDLKPWKQTGEDIIIFLLHVNRGKRIGSDPYLEVKITDRFEYFHLVRLHRVLR